MYTIIGSDGKEYGPVTAAEIRSWIAGGRANLETRAKAVGTEEWKPLEEFADFGGPEDEPPPFRTEPPPLPGADDRRRGAAGPPVEFSPLDCFVRSWALLKANFWPLVSVTMLVGAVQVAVDLAFGPKTDGVTDLTTVLQTYRDYFQSTGFRLQEGANLLVLLPLGAGLQYYFLRRIRHQTATARDLFAGFGGAYLHLVLASLLILIFTTLGFICFVLPAIYLVVAYYPFTFLAIVDGRAGFWASMEASRRAVTRHWWSVLLMIIIGMILLVAVAMIFLIAGFLSTGIGILVALPFSFVALPLIVGAFSYAYEDLCGGPLKSDPEPVNSALPTA
jgi:hypothetical protein